MAEKTTSESGRRKVGKTGRESQENVFRGIRYGKNLKRKGDYREPAAIGKKS